MRQEELAGLVRRLLDEEGFELVECSVSRTPRSQMFRVSIDREEGVPIEACVRMSRRISDVLDGDPVLRGTYNLEVSSPGMNRPIWKREHYQRFQGERVRIEVAGPDGTRQHLHGAIAGVEGSELRLRFENGEERRVRLEQIVRAHLQIDPWKHRPTGAAASPARAERKRPPRSRVSGERPAGGGVRAGRSRPGPRGRTDRGE